jgi:RND superfamily putative drug exporter
MLERVREARRAGADPASAAAQAVASTAGTVTGAAMVMIGVFAFFATLRLLEFKQLGIGLAAAIAIDATIVRGVALPAVVTLLGERGGRMPVRRRRGVPTPTAAEPGWNHGTQVATLRSSSD